MKLRLRKKIDPIHLAPGDSLHLTYTDERGKTQTLLRDACDVAATINEVATVDVEPGDLGDKNITGGLGGLFLETKDS